MRIYRISLLLALSLILALTPGCSGDDPVQPPLSDPALHCVDYRDFLHVSSTTKAEFWLSGEMVIVDGLAYIANERGGLVIADVSDPGDVRVLGQVDLPRYPVAVDVVDGYALVACSASNRLVVVDASDPTNPTIADDSLLREYVTNVTVVGSMAYVGIGSRGIQVIDVSDPVAPVIGRIVSTGRPKRIVAEGERLYVLDDSQVHVLEIGDPADPEPVDIIDFGEVDLEDVAVQGDLLFAVSVSSLYVVDLSTGAVIVDGQMINEGIQFQRIVLRGTEAYFLSEYYWDRGGVYVYDIGDPAAPARIGMVPLAEVFAIDVTDNRIFVADGQTGINTIVPGPPAEELSLGSAVLSGRYNSISVNGTLAACGSDWDDRFCLVDLTDPAAPRVTSEFEMLLVRDIALAADFAYVAQGPYGLQIVDVTDPVAPELRGNVMFPGPGDAWEVAVAGDLALVVDNEVGLQIVDVSDPDAPAVVGALNTPGHVIGVARLGDLAIVTGGFPSIQVIDWSDPTAPALVGSLDTPGQATGVAVANGLVYVADGSALLIVDVSTPSAPVIVGSQLAINGHAYRVVVDDDRAYVFGHYSGLMVVDVSSPASPSLVAVPGLMVEGGAAFAVSPYGFGIVVGEEIATVPLQCGSERGPQWW